MKTMTMPCPHCEGKGKVPDPRRVGMALRLQRKQARKSLTEVAEAMGITPPYLSDMELGRREFTEDMKQLFKNAIKT